MANEIMRFKLTLNNSSTDLDDTPKNVERKLEIISSVPLVRSLRALQYWQHPMSLILRSRLHAASILVGEGPGQPRTSSQSAKVNAQHLQNKGNTWKLFKSLYSDFLNVGWVLTVHSRGCSSHENIEFRWCWNALFVIIVTLPWYDTL